jgi:hypothetical protein
LPQAVFESNRQAHVLGGHSVPISNNINVATVCVAGCREERSRKGASLDNRLAEPVLWINHNAMLYVPARRELSILRVVYVLEIRQDNPGEQLLTLDDIDKLLIPGFFGDSQENTLSVRV